jgi:hypothetical protein
VSTTLYQQRFKEHLGSAKKLYEQSDYVQASEKVWGALSAFINTQSKTECKSKDEKRTFFVGNLYRYLLKDKRLQNEMSRLGFKGCIDVFENAYGLHLFFYGGLNLANPQVSSIIAFLIEVLESLRQNVHLPP